MSNRPMKEPPPPAPARPYPVTDARAATSLATQPSSELLRPWLEHINGRIKAAARKGQRKVIDPYQAEDGSPLRTPLPNDDVREAVRNAFLDAGYEWEEHDERLANPTPTDTGRWTELRW